MDSAAIKNGLEVITTAIGTLKSVVGIVGSVKDDEGVKRQVNDVAEKLAAAREKYIALQDDYIAAVEENRQLRAKLADHVEGEPCPKCLRKGWHVESSEPDNQFGVAGVFFRKLYKCSFCGFSENKLAR